MPSIICRNDHDPVEIGCEDLITVFFIRAHGIPNHRKCSIGDLLAFGVFGVQLRNTLDVFGGELEPRRDVFVGRRSRIGIIERDPCIKNGD